MNACIFEYQKNRPGWWIQKKSGITKGVHWLAKKNPVVFKTRRRAFLLPARKPHAFFWQNDLCIKSLQKRSNFLHFPYRNEQIFVSGIYIFPGQFLCPSVEPCDAQNFFLQLPGKCHFGECTCPATCSNENVGSSDDEDVSRYSHARGYGHINKLVCPAAVVSRKNTDGLPFKSIARFFGTFADRFHKATHAAANKYPVGRCQVFSQL